MRHGTHTSQDVKLPSNRKFGWFFTILFAAFGCYAYLKAKVGISSAALIFSFVFAVLTLAAPQLLTPLNRIWYGLGLLLGKIVSPIVLGVIFFIILTPISLITRLFGRDELRLKQRPIDSYWVDRSPPGPPPDSFKNQY